MAPEQITVMLRTSLDDLRFRLLHSDGMPARSLGIAVHAALVHIHPRSRTELLDLVRAGVLEQVPGRGRCQLTADSLRAWIAASA